MSFRDLRAWVCLWLLWPLSAASAQPAQLAGEPERTLSPYFFVDAPDGVEPFTLEATHVRAEVDGVIADVTIEQTYRNGGTLPIHARYVFPASTRAAVHGMQIQLGHKRVVAKIKPREQAAEEFQRAADSGKTASLLEQQRPNVFSMDVSNILPGDRVVVSLQYSELLVPRDGIYQFVYPTVVGPRYSKTPRGSRERSETFVETPLLQPGDSPPSAFTLEVSLSTPIPIAALRCGTHRVHVERKQATLARVALVPGQGFAANRDFVLEFSLAAEQIQTGLSLYRGERENHFLLMLEPPARVAPEQIPPREYVFVLDVSGSMTGFPLDTAKALMAQLIANLRPSDVFNVLLFSGDSQLMAERSLPATAPNLARAHALIDAERGAGGTELEAALRVALELPRAAHVSRSVIVLTDGFIAQERGAFELIARHLSDTNVFAFGIGSSVNRYLIEGLARAGQGEPFVVTDPAEAPAVAERLRRYIESPVLTDISVRFEGFDAYAVEPARQPDLFAQRPIVVLGKWRGQPVGEIEVTGKSAAGRYVRRIAVAHQSPRAENAALAQLWARMRIARLSDFDPEGEDPESVRQVTELGLGYSLLTQHTSFVAVLEQIRNPSGEAVDVEQALALPAGVSMGEHGYPCGAEPELPWLCAFALLGWAGFAYARTRRFAGAGRGA